LIAHFSLRAASGTHPGQVRTVNQDSVLAYVRSQNMGDALGLFVVADGMGGHQAGEVASRLAVETIRENLSWMLEQDDSGATAPGESEAGENETPDQVTRLERRLQLAVKEANRVIYNYAKQNPLKAGNLGCTATCAIVYGDVAAIANVGDSRTYLLGKNGFQQITNDHSYVWQLAREGHLQYEEIFDHPQRNVITRALGNQPEVEVDSWSRELAVGDRLFLCSDGVWEMIRDPGEMAEMLKADHLEGAVRQLIEAANHYGGADNIGVVIAELQDSNA
jgi:serine/threonine protein phosphatase PrpC